MIASLRGVVAQKELDTIVIEVGGVGYEVSLTRQAAEALQPGDDATVLVAESIREDSFTLYGFVDGVQRGLYRQLLGVNGVGPKVALNIVSTHDSSALMQAIRTGQPVLFSSVSGVGAKTAQRIVLELKGKIDLSAETTTSNDSAHQAMIALGYSAQQASEALRGIDAKLPTEERIKLALKGLGGTRK